MDFCNLKLCRIFSSPLLLSTVSVIVFYVRNDSTLFIWYRHSNNVVYKSMCITGIKQLSQPIIAPQSFVYLYQIHLRQQGEFENITVYKFTGRRKCHFKCRSVIKILISTSTSLHCTIYGYGTISTEVILC